jgi:Uma2 family endonuclease
MNAAITNTMAERIAELGGIAPQRIRLEPAPGTATVEDLANYNATHSPLCELIDGTLVERAVGYKSSLVAITIATILRSFVAPRKLGVISGADGMFQLIPGTTRGPDVAFTSAARLPGGKIPSEAYPPIAPDLVIEVLSPGNTKAEMSRKRIEYFHSGVKLVWIVDCDDRSVAVYTSPSSVIELKETQSIDGGEVLLGFSSPVADFFADLDFYQDPTASL